jgi:hypothetical protein
MLIAIWYFSFIVDTNVLLTKLRAGLIEAHQ